MPTYEYRCPKGHHFDLFQRMSDEPVAACPECGAEAERIISGGAGFLFKGDGFYITDSRSDAYKKDASKEKGPELPSTDAGAGAAAAKKEKAPPAPAKEAKAGTEPSTGS